MRYKFSSEMQPPSYHQGTDYGEADVAANANGNLSNGAEAGYYCILYDPWNCHSGVASANTSPNHYNFYDAGDLHVRIFAPRKQDNSDIDRTPYSVDIPITGNGLASLKSALASRGPIWAHCGFPTVESMCGWTDPGQNGLPGLEHWGQEPFQTVFLYCSRLELVIKATWPTTLNPDI